MSTKMNPNNVEDMRRINLELRRKMEKLEAEVANERKLSEEKVRSMEDNMKFLEEMMKVRYNLRFILHTHSS